MEGLPGQESKRPKNVRITPLLIETAKSDGKNGRDEIQALERELQQFKVSGNDLEGKLKTAEELLDDVDKENVALKQRSLKYVISEKEAGIDTLERRLDENRSLYCKVQEELIGSLFKIVAGKIDERHFYGTEESISGARSTIKEKETYLKTYGMEALRHLPLAAREITAKSWDDAEKTIKQYEEEINKIEEIDLPIHFAEQSNKVYIALPLKQSGTGKVTQALERELNEFRRRISSSNVKSTVEQTEYRTSITLELEGATSKAISADLHDALNNLLRDAKISPSFIYTEFMPGVGIEKNVGKAGRIKDEQKDNDSLANFISVKMRERGYSDAVTLAQQAGVLPITVRRIMNGDYTRCPNQTTIIKLASALGITEEEFRSKL